MGTKASFSSLSAFPEIDDTEDTTDDQVARTSSIEVRNRQHDECMNRTTIDKKHEGVNVAGKFGCHECNQIFDTERAVKLHCKFMHSHHESQNGYSLVYEFNAHDKVDAQKDMHSIAWMHNSLYFRQFLRN